MVKRAVTSHLPNDAPQKRWIQRNDIVQITPSTLRTETGTAHDGQLQHDEHGRGDDGGRRRPAQQLGGPLRHLWPVGRARPRRSLWGAAYVHRPGPHLVR